MQCPKCGNEVSQDEAFCGQCGTPITPPSQPSEMVQAPRSGQLNAYNNPNMLPSTQTYKSGMLPPANPYNPTNANRQGAYGGNITPQVNQNQQPPNHTTSFYQDATEAMSAVPPANTNQIYPPGYQQQSYAGVPTQSGYPGAGQYNSQVQQPFPPGNYTQHGFPLTPQFPTGQSYNYAPQPQPKATPVPQKQQGNTALVIACVCLVIALIAAVGFGALYLTRNHSPQKASVTPTVLPTTAPTPTVAPSPTAAATATPTPVPTPTLTPTPAPDANFSWCSAACTANGFTVEFPNGWNQGQTNDKTGIQFLDPQPPDVYAAFKTPGPTTSTASALVANDLQTNFANQYQQSYTPPTTSGNTTIGGENWTYEVAYFQLNNQKERIEVFATVHQGKAYIIELEASDSQFDSYNTAYFTTMIGRFQFLPSAS